MRKGAGFILHPLRGGFSNERDVPYPFIQFYLKFFQMKKVIAFAIHFVLFLIASVLIWNYAYELAKLTDMPVLFYDITAFVFGFISFTFSLLTTHTWVAKKEEAKNTRKKII